MAPDVLQTISFIRDAHWNQTDKGGLPYWRHPMRVMLRLPRWIGDDARKGALLHDVVEDTPITLDNLREVGHTEATIRIVDLLTKTSGQTHGQYRDRLLGSGNEEAILVKLADLYDNTAPSRDAPLLERSWLRERYNLFITYIKSQLPVELWRDVRHGDLHLDETEK